jgi:hypothetical protein
MPTTGAANGWVLAMAETEHDLQKRIITWRDAMEPQYPELGRLHMINNESLVSYIPRARQMAFRNHLRCLGMVAGVSDLFLPALRFVDGSVRGGLYLELKRPGTASIQKALTPSQDAWLKALSADYMCYAISTFNGAINAIQHYIAQPHPKEVLHGHHCLR